MNLPSPEVVRPRHSRPQLQDSSTVQSVARNNPPLSSSWHAVVADCVGRVFCRNVPAPQLGEDGQSDQFQTGLLECTLDWRSTAEVCVCPCLATSQQYYMLTTGDRGTHLGLCLLSLCGNVLVVVVPLMIAAATTRLAARKTFVLEGENALLECLVGCCCAPCSTCQVYREMSLRDFWPGGECCITDRFHLDNARRRLPQRQQQENTHQGHRGKPNLAAESVHVQQPDQQPAYCVLQESVSAFIEPLSHGGSVVVVTGSGEAPAVQPSSSHTQGTHLHLNPLTVMT